MGQKKKLEIKNISNLPSLPPVMKKLTKLLENPETTAEKVGKVISTDLSLSSKVLKLVNSAFYGFPGKISSIDHSVVILGYSTIKNVVLTASILDTMKFKSYNQQENKYFRPEDFWKHSVASGAAAQAISGFLSFRLKSDPFIMGLIHDLGKIVMFEYLYEEFNTILHKAQEEGLTFFEAENSIFESTHQEIGAGIIKEWNLPPSLRNAILHHHDPDPEQPDYLDCALAHCSNIIVNAIREDMNGNTRLAKIDHNAWKALGLDKVPMEKMIKAITKEIKKSESILSL
ncbi:MAG: HDOD domain-containing protein [Chitinivibrionales bacterium]